MPDRGEQRSGRWNDDEDKELARRLNEQAEKDRLAREALEKKEQKENP